MADLQDEYKHLIAPIEDRMIRTLWRILRDPDDADDALAEALAIIWRRLEYVRRHANPHALILRICVNAAHDLLRKKARHGRRFVGFDSLAEEHAPDPAPSAKERLLNKELRSEILAAIGRLPRRQAEAMLLRFSQDLSYGEIAQALACSEVSARKLVSRAHQRLAGLLAHLATQRPGEAIP